MVNISCLQGISSKFCRKYMRFTAIEPLPTLFCFDVDFQGVIERTKQENENYAKAIHANLNYAELIAFYEFLNDDCYDVSTSQKNFIDVWHLWRT